MRLIIILFFVLLFGCQTKQQQIGSNNTVPPLPHDKEIKIDYQVHNICSTYYIRADDTLHPILAKVTSYDEEGREKEIIYRSFESYVPATCVILYDSLGKKGVQYYRIDEDDKQNTLTKTIFYYNEEGRLARSISFDFRRRIRKDLDKGLGRPGGCIISEDDYEKYKSWGLATMWNYLYDDRGHLIEKVAPVINSSQNRYLYQYDTKGKLIEERSLEDNRLIWIEHYNYDQAGYEFTRIWFEDDGTRRKEWDGSIALIDTFRFKTDKNNNVTQELVIEEGGRIVNKQNKYYDDRNRLIKEEIFSDSGKLLGYYIYDYITVNKPVHKTFKVSAK